MVSSGSNGERADAISSKGRSDEERVLTRTNKGVHNTTIQSLSSQDPPSTPRMRVCHSAPPSTHHNVCVPVGVKKQSFFRTLRLIVWNKHHLVRRVVFAVQLAVDARPRHRLEIPAHRMETHLREPNRPPRTRHVGREPHRAQRRHREVSALVKLLADVERRRSSKHYGLTL